MPNILIALKKILSLLKREKMHRVLIFVLIVLFSGTGLLVFFEKNLGFFDALWWSIVTMTTVGYGDISPVTPGGRAVAIFVMVAGIGLIGLLTATIAGIILEEKFMENKGMKKTTFSDHFIICGWNSRGETIISEMVADPKWATIPIVIIAEIDEKPQSRETIFFIRGQINNDSLDKANGVNAAAAIILSDDTLDTYARDAKTILRTMAVKNHCPDLYTCVELMDPKNMDHCTMAKADEIIVVGEISTNLLVQAALNHGITRLVSELVSNRYGNDLYKIKVPPYLVGKTFFKALCELKEKEDIICIGIEDKSGFVLHANPKNDYPLKKEDYLITIAWDRPMIG